MVASNDAIYNPHLKLTWGGTIGDPEVEQWTNGLRFIDFSEGGLPDDGDLQTALNELAPIIQTWFLNPDLGIGNAARLVWAKLNKLDESGLQPGNTIRHDFPAAIWGPTAANPSWNQTFAITFRTASQRGRAHAGRIFPPLMAAQPAGKSPYVNKVVADLCAQATGQLLGNLSIALNASLGGVGAAGRNFVPAVVSPGLKSKGTQEMRAQITSVVMDRVPDTQHRRTKQVNRNEGSPYVILYGGDQ